MKEIKILLLYPPEQSWPGTMVKPNGSLAYPYLGGALRDINIETYVYDACVGNNDDNLDEKGKKDLIEKCRIIGDEILELSIKPIKNKVKIAFGTDSGVSKHGDNAKELELLVNYGMTPKEAIKSATVEAAKLLGQSEHLGDLSVGKQADIISVNMNVLDNISELRNVRFVMKGGDVLKQ